MAWRVTRWPRRNRCSTPWIFCVFCCAIRSCMIIRLRHDLVGHQRPPAEKALQKCCVHAQVTDEAAHAQETRRDWAPPPIFAGAASAAPHSHCQAARGEYADDDRWRRIVRSSDDIASHTTAHTANACPGRTFARARRCSSPFIWRRSLERGAAATMTITCWSAWIRDIVKHLASSGARSTLPPDGPRNHRPRRPVG